MGDPKEDLPRNKRTSLQSERFNPVDGGSDLGFRDNQDVELGLIDERVYFEPKGVEQALSLWFFRKPIQGEGGPCASGKDRDHGFELKRILVKSQRTRWASCSWDRIVSLNLKLLFIPEDLIRYALIHELCHTVHLNHSLEFRALLNHHEPDFAKKDEKLRSAWRSLPACLDAKKMRGEK